MNLSSLPILSIITYIPLAGALLIVFLVPKEKTGTIKAIATAVAALDFVVSLMCMARIQRPAVFGSSPRCCSSTRLGSTCRSASPLSQ